ncbi:MAG: class I SAM-dependent methyltransferase [Spirochaetes bacterium]|nr:class I SAM-dependent methyltransferase [Spirochaetota bacterium]
MIRDFLEKRAGTWHEHNIPEYDGKILYDIIVENNYTRILEIGTSSGHSGIWMAWALSKTNGRLITIEINEGRYQKAVSNFREAGVSDIIDAISGNAHNILDELEGPFDLIFCDADKDFYKQYFTDLYPRLVKGGCYTAHNVYDTSPKRQFKSNGITEFYQYVKSLDYMETTLDESAGGLSISYKKY